MQVFGKTGDTAWTSGNGPLISIMKAIKNALYQPGAIDFTTSVTEVSTQLFPAAAAGTHNHVSSLQISCNGTSVANTLTIYHGVSPIAVFFIPAGVFNHCVNFTTPVHGPSNGAINAQLAIAPVGTVKVNIQGFTAA